MKAEYRFVAKAIDQFPDMKSGMDESSGHQFRELTSVLKEKRMFGYFFQPNRTKVTFANLYRDMIKNAPLTYGAMNRYDVEERLSLRGKRFSSIARPNAVGRILYGLFVPAVDSQLEQKCRAECSISATRLVVACNAYYRKEGKWPEDLQSLVPAYLPAVPTDPFDGKPFRYVPAKGIVYSVGKDLRDSGGSERVLAKNASKSTAGNRWLAEDAVFEIGQLGEKQPQTGR
jgi:hypothetical protein